MRKDIALDQNNDLKIVNGDFAITSSDQQHVQIITSAHQGEFKEWPLVGFGASAYLKQSTLNAVKFVRDLKVQLANDGYSNAKIHTDPTLKTLEIDL